ncbi:MAG: alpha/beta hydrolase [Sulfitobacter sp.]
MALSPAPFFTDVCPGPDGGAAFWADTADGVRIRLGLWPCPNAKGTVLLLPGRTEYIEKYGASATELAKRGFSTLCIDWRGQGLADRLLTDARIGHVESFEDYQRDMAAMLDAAMTLDLPKPFYLLAHSMGGCIGLRALLQDLPVQAAAFTGPMWGIRIAPLLVPPAYLLSCLMPAIGLGHGLPPQTSYEAYVLANPFQDNLLTSDMRMYDMMRDQLLAHPELALGGPSYVWLAQALTETNDLARHAAPNIRCATYLGSDEQIVSVPRIHQRMAGWKNGQLDVIKGGAHEVLMEGPDITDPLFEDIARFFVDAKSD